MNLPIYKGLEFTTKEINMNFRIKLNMPGRFIMMDEVKLIDGQRVVIQKKQVIKKLVSKSLGVAGLIRFYAGTDQMTDKVHEEAVGKVNRVIKRAFAHNNVDVYTANPRRGATLRFYCK